MRCRFGAGTRPSLQVLMTAITDGGFGMIDRMMALPLNAEFTTSPRCYAVVMPFHTTYIV